MHHRPYAVDALSQAQDLADTILAASSPSQISSVCASISTYLRSFPTDQSRHFFSLTFPSFICKLFGFADFSASHASPLQSNASGWINIINQSNDPNLMSDVLSFLSPSGILFQSIFSADRHSLVRYVFPTERLPEWFRPLLANDKCGQIVNLLCPLFSGRIIETLNKNSPLCQVQLSIFEYFVFWFAYYPICKGNYETSTAVSVKRSKRFRLENWAISRLSSTKGGNSKRGSNLYLLLLYAYLREFVPFDDVHTHLQSCRSSLLLYDNDGNGGVIQERAGFIVDALVNYWLVDNDPSPLPVNVAKSFGVVTSMLWETAPVAYLGDVVKMLVEYMLVRAVVRSGEATRKQWISSSLNNRLQCAGDFDVPWNSCFQRAVYRYILRTFLFCPIGTSLKNASDVFSVWTSYLEPWKIRTDHLSELDALINRSGNDRRNADADIKNSPYSSLWENYVLSNYLYYTSLVIHFVGFCHKFLLSDPQCTIQMVLKIVEILTASKEMVNLLKEMDSSFRSKVSASSKSTFSSFDKYVPSIREKLQDWENGLSETDSDGTFLHENWNKNLKLFSETEDGGQQLLQLFIMRAESLLHSMTGDGVAENLQRLDSLREKLPILFGGNATQSPTPTSAKRQQDLQCREEVFTPRKLRQKPTSDGTCSAGEVGWLAALLVRFSRTLNECMGLNQPVSHNQKQYTEISRSSSNIIGFKDTMKWLILAVCCWCVALGTSLLDWMRVRGVRVNLRTLASKRVVTFTLICMFCSLFRLLSNFLVQK